MAGVALMRRSTMPAEPCGAAQAVVDAQPGVLLRRRFDQDHVGAGAVHRAQRRVQGVASLPGSKGSARAAWTAGSAP
jgi:hypothetical protein